MSAAARPPEGGAPLPRGGRRASRQEGSPVKRCARGQSLVEYTILLGLIGLVLVIGEDSPLEALFRAIQGYYGRFTYSLSMP